VHELTNQTYAGLKFFYRQRFEPLAVDRAVAGAESHDCASFGDFIERCGCSGDDSWVTKNEIGHRDAEQQALGDHGAAGQGLK
jgi:hypothetical protein